MNERRQLYETRRLYRNTLRRLSTRTFAARALENMENAQKLREAFALPQIVDILDTMDAMQGARFFILAPYQSFKSLVGQFRLLRNFYLRPGPCGWYAPSDDFAKEFAALKWGPLFDSQPLCQSLLYHGSTGKPDASKKTTQRYSLAGGSSLLLLSAATENDRHGKTVRDIYCDETHRYGFTARGAAYEAGWREQISNRRGNYSESGDWTELDMSTGLTGGTEAATLWASTDQRTWHVRCPACRKLFLPLFTHRHPDTQEIIGGLRYEKHFLANGLPHEQAIAETLRHECPKCHATLPDAPGSRTLLSGTAAKPRGIYIAQNENAAARAIGWNFTAITIRPWLHIAIRFEKAMLAFRRGDPEPLANWIREEMGGIWDPAEHFNAQKTKPLGREPYAMGEPWKDEAKDKGGRPMRTAGVDVQQDHFVLVIRKWAEDARSRLHWAEKITTRGRLQETLDKHQVFPRRVFLDTRYDSETVRRYAQDAGWCCFFGEGEKDYLHPDLGVRRIYSEARYMDAWNGTDQGGRGRVAEFNFSKPSALSRMHLLRTLESNSGNPMWTAAHDAPAWYWKEIDAFHRIRKEPKGGGEAYYEYVVHGPDHGADAEALNVVIASMLGLVGAESVESAAKKSQEKKS